MGPQGNKQKEAESACSFIALGYLPVFAVLLLKYGAIASVGILLWFGLWYGFRGVCNRGRMRIALTYFPLLLAAVIFRTPIAVSYGTLLWWLHEDVKKLP